MAFVRGDANSLGWRNLTFENDEAHCGHNFPDSSIPLLLIHHLSDLHVCDAQSPTRPEYLDRQADPDSPIREQVGTIGTYRPHSMLSPHVVESMVQSLNTITKGPLSGHEIVGAIITGDTTDNAQKNEVDWYLALLDGLEIRPDSGDFSKYEGVIDDGADHYDVRYWHPHGTPPGKVDDDARAKYGFPLVPNLLNSCRAPFKATGLKFPWFAVHGNHDALLQGTVAPTAEVIGEMVGDKRYIGLPTTTNLFEVLMQFREVGPAGYPAADDAPFIHVAPELERRAIERGEYAQLHLNSPGFPRGHGFNDDNVKNKTMYYSTLLQGVKLIVIDSVNHFGGWQGSLDSEQFEWLEKEVSESDRPVVLASHHPLSKMFNDYAPIGRRICVDEIREMLLKYPKVIAWLAGHEHRHHVEWIGDVEEVKGFWQIETASHADWPQQSRTVEIVQSKGGDVFIGLSVVDHAAGIDYDEAKTPLEIAALSRVVSANVWQRRPELGAKHGIDWWLGRPEDRNVVLKIHAR
jgi:metallophosphoesterase (TIGR03767 family)